MSEFKPFDNQLAGLLAALSPAGRRKLAGEIAKQLRTAQQQRIKQQKAPDGSPYQARKRQPLRAKQGRIKRAMFQKLRTNRYMKPVAVKTVLWWNLPEKCSVSRVSISTASKTGQTRTLRMFSMQSASYSDLVRRINNVLRVLLSNI